MFFSPDAIRLAISHPTQIQDNYYQNSQFESCIEDVISTKKANLNAFIDLLHSHSPSPLFGAYMMPTSSNTTASPIWKEEVPQIFFTQ
jgi:hypothetical protein